MGMISMNIIRRASVFTAATAMGALVIFAASGCGGARTAVTTNGLEKKTGAQVARDAAGAIEAAKSVHVKGVIFGPRYRFDVRIQGADRAGTETLAGGQAQVVIIGSDTGIGSADTYLKAGPEVLAKNFRASAPVRLLAGRWLKVPPAVGVSLEGYGFSLQGFGTALVTFFSPPEPTVRQAVLDGRKVVVVSYRDGSKLYVANTGPAYPLRWDNKGPGAGWTDFTKYGANFHIAAPGNVIDLTGQG